MPQIIEHIDAIARQKGRTVLFIDFPIYVNLDSLMPCSQYEMMENGESEQIVRFCREHVENYEPRNKFLEFLDSNGIAWMPCGEFASENGFSCWRGQTYIDIEFDTSNPVYKKVEEYLENSDGTPKDSLMGFYYLPLEEAMKNSHHDAPGFWGDWADNF